MLRQQWPFQGMARSGIVSLSPTPWSANYTDHSSVRRSVGCDNAESQGHCEDASPGNSGNEHGERKKKRKKKSLIGITRNKKKPVRKETGLLLGNVNSIDSTPQARQAQRCRMVPKADRQWSANPPAACGTTVTTAEKNGRWGQSFWHEIFAQLPAKEFRLMFGGGLFRQRLLQE